MFKILCTGNPSDIGIAMEIKKLYPNTKFLSRTSGYDLSTDQGLDALRMLLPEYNVFINNAYIMPGRQLDILKVIIDKWTTGNVFNIGSIDEYERYGTTNRSNQIEKNQLKEYGINHTNEKLKITHITVGGFKSEHKPGSMPNMHPKHIAETIQWILNAEFEVPVIGVQQITDYVRNWYEGRRDD